MGMVRLAAVLFVVIIIFTLPALAKPVKDLPDKPTKVIIAQTYRESRNNDKAIGDKKFPPSRRAYGWLQVRKPCVDDVNKHFGTHYKAKDCLGNRALSLWIYQKYMEIHATKKALGRDPTDEDKARIWNGGPNGWKKSSTLAYWAAIKWWLKKLFGC